MPIRRATLADAETVSAAGREHLHRTFGHLYSDADLQAFLRDSYAADGSKVIARPTRLCACWLLEEEGEAVGYARPAHVACRMRMSRRRRRRAQAPVRAARHQNGGWRCALFEAAHGLAAARRPAHAVDRRVVREPRRAAVLCAATVSRGPATTTSSSAARVTTNSSCAARHSVSRLLSCRPPPSIPDDDQTGVVLLHGLWMPGACRCTGWRSALREAGFAPEIFGYDSVAGGPDAAIPRLADRCERSPAHVVAHSLGGLVALQAWQRHPASCRCRARRLPGLAAVRQRRRRRPGRPAWTAPMLGRSADAAAARLRAAGTGRAEVGVIAGRTPLRAGRAVSAASRTTTTAPWRSPKPGCRAWPTIPWSQPATAGCCSRPKWRGWRSPSSAAAASR